MLRLYQSTSAAAAASTRQIAARTVARAATAHTRTFSSNDDSRQQQQQKPARPFWKRPVGMAIGAYLAFCAVGFLISPMEQAKKKQHAAKHKKDEHEAEHKEETQEETKPAAKATTTKVAEPRSEPKSSTPHVAAPVQPAAPAAPVAPIAAIAAPVAATTAEEDEDEAAAEAAFEAEYNARPANRERSAAAHTIPGRPFVFSLTAAEIPRRVQLRTSDVLLHVFDPTASVSQLQRPVLDAVAKALHDVQSMPVSAASAVSAPLQVLAMDSSANVFPVLLAAQGENESESHRLSKLIFYPKCGSQLYSAEERSKPECQPTLFSPMHARTEKLLDFAHERIGAQSAVHSESTVAFDLAAAHALGQSAEPAVRTQVGDLLRSTLSKPLSPQTWRSSDVAFVAPCGSLLRSLVERQTALEFESYNSEAEMKRKRAEIAAIVDKHSQCQTKEKQQINKFIAETKQQLTWMEKRE